MNEEIEKLKQERDEILAKVGELDRLTHDPESGINWPQVHAILEELKSLRPKPEPLEFWVNVYNDEHVSPIAQIFIHETEDQAKRNGGSKKARIAVRMREVTPAPKWERWDGETVRCDIYYSMTGDTVSEAWQRVADAHNAEMERLAALWEGGADE